MILVALALAAASVGPAKLVILNGESGVAITDFASMARCEAARREMIAKMLKGEVLANGQIMLRHGVSLFCIPG